MAGRVVHPDPVVAEPPRARSVVKEVDRRLRIHANAEGQSLLNDRTVEELVVAVQADGNAERSLGAPDTGDVVEVRVGEQDVSDRQAGVRSIDDEQLVDLVAGVDEHAFPSVLAADDIAVLEERSDGARLEQHG